MVSSWFCSFSYLPPLLLLSFLPLLISAVQPLIFWCCFLQSYVVCDDSADGWHYLLENDWLGSDTLIINTSFSFFCFSHILIHFILDVLFSKLTIVFIHSFCLPWLTKFPLIFQKKSSIFLSLGYEVLENFKSLSLVLLNIFI